MVIHELKVWSDFWDALKEGRKTFEMRYDDRGFVVDDLLVLRKFDHRKDCYDEQAEPVVCTVTYIMRSGFGLKDGWVCMGLKFEGRNVYGCLHLITSPVPIGEPFVSVGKSLMCTVCGLYYAD